MSITHDIDKHHKNYVCPQMLHLQRVICTVSGKDALCLVQGWTMQ